METRRYPDLIVVGPQKSGTTTLYGLFRQHPDIFMPDEKETHYFASGGQKPDFTDSAAQGLNAEAIWRREDYEALYASSDAPLKVEVCPTYLYAPGAAAAIAVVRPDARIVAILRDPVERSFSAYRHMKARGAEKAKSFEEALAAEPAHIALNWQAMAHYTATSFYAPQLIRYYEQFPREQIIVLDFDDLQFDPIGTANQILAFSGTAPLPGGIRMGQTNRTVVPKSGLFKHLLIDQPRWARQARKLLPKAHRARIREWVVSKLPYENELLQPDTRARLVALFREDVLATRELTGQAFEGWTV